MDKYFRIVCYSPELDVTMILDSYGRYEKKWQFSSELLKIGLKILEVSTLEETFDSNFESINKPVLHTVVLRGYAKGKITLRIDYYGTLVSVRNKHYTIKHDL